MTFQFIVLCKQNYTIERFDNLAVINLLLQNKLEEIKVFKEKRNVSLEYVEYFISFMLETAYYDRKDKFFEEFGSLMQKYYSPCKL
jgi:hypothetical protein